MIRAARFLVVLALASLTLALAPSPSGAGTPPQSVTGEVRCAADGTQEITWTFTNPAGYEVNIISSEQSGAVTGPVTFSQNPVPAAGSASAVDSADGSVTGTVTLTVTYDYELLVRQIPTIEADVELEGCVQPTTTTVGPTTTAAAAAQPAAAQADQPTFTG